MSLSIVTRAAGHLLAAALLALTLSTAQAANGVDRKLAQTALDMMDEGKWNAALAVALPAPDRAVPTMVRWLAYQHPHSGASFADIAEFLAEYPDWPRSGTLRARAETAMTGAESPTEVLAFFDANPPLTVDGATAHVRALLATGDRAAATRAAREHWVDKTFNAGQETEWLNEFGGLIDPATQRARLHRLLWDRDTDQARRQMNRVDAAHQALARARIALYQRQPGVDAAVNAVPAGLQNDPGLLYDRLRWRRRAGLNDGAREILNQAPAELGRPDLWWKERHIQVREALSEGAVTSAYRLAADHGLAPDDGYPWAEAEWTAGWLALRWLDDPALALPHFVRFHQEVGTAISLARGAFWAGEAAAALGRDEEARRWYAEAAGYPTTFYGQLAATRIGQDPMAGVGPLPPVAPAMRRAFADDHRVTAARLLVELDRPKDADALLYGLQRAAETPDQHRLTAELMAELGRPSLAVFQARDANRDNITLYELGYPVIPTRGISRPEPALIHAVIRQESSFAPDVISRAGARGMMQLMPGTARDQARRLGLPYDSGRLLSDPHYNMVLGSDYLARMLDRYDGSYVLAIAAYNAGPGNVDRWLARNGDPRRPGVDTIDWIESIPYNETRNYVQRVMEAVALFRQRLGTPGQTIAEDLKRG